MSRHTKGTGYFDLFFTFARIGVCTFGGGYAMLPLLQREICQQKGWATQEELTDYFAIGQCTPGIIAVNTATFVGYQQRGIFGGIWATLGLVFPCLIIITLIAAFLQNLPNAPAVQHAMSGIHAAVVALITTSVLSLGRRTLHKGVSLLLFILVLVLAQFFGVSPVYLVLGSGFLGYVAYQLSRLDRHRRNPEI